MLTDDLKWDLNVSTIVKKANARMELLRRVASFGTPREDMKTIYTLFVRSLLEQSATGTYTNPFSRTYCISVSKVQWMGSESRNPHPILILFSEPKGEGLMDSSTSHDLRY